MVRVPCKSPHFGFLRDGIKGCDLRSRKPTYDKIVEDQEITFYHCGPRPVGQDLSNFTLRVLRTVKTNPGEDNLYEFFQRVPVNEVFPGVDDVEEGVQKMRKVYKKFPSEEREFGVVGFIFKESIVETSGVAVPASGVTVSAPIPVSGPEPLIYHVCYDKVDGTDEYTFWGRVKDSNVMEELDNKWLQDNLIDNNYRGRCVDYKGVCSCSWFRCFIFIFYCCPHLIINPLLMCVQIHHYNTLLCTHTHTHTHTHYF